MPRLLEPLTDEEKEAANRMIQAFSTFNAFVFELPERKLFFNVIHKVGLEPLITIKELRRRKVIIYVVLLNERPCINECQYRCRGKKGDEQRKCIHECVEKCMGERKEYLINALRESSKKNS